MSVKPPGFGGLLFSGVANPATIILTLCIMVLDYTAGKAKGMDTMISLGWGRFVMI